MSATVTYKGETLTTATNQTRVLETEGKYLEDDITITDVTGAAPSGTKNISITANGTTTEDVTSYATASITTAVPASAVDSGTKSISTNGTHDVIGYASANVAVPNSYSASDEGKVVSSGALVSQTAHADVTPTTSDQTIDTTTNNSIKVKGDADLVAGNIKKDVEIFGVTGSYEGGGGGDPLPTGYTQMLYLESSGTQYIDTGLYTKATHKYDVKFSCGSGTTNIFGNNLSSGCGAFIQSVGASSYYRFGSANYSSKGDRFLNNMTAFDRITIGGIYGYDETQKQWYLLGANGTSSVTENSTIHNILFGRTTGTNSRQLSASKIYRFTCYDGNTIIMDLYPAMRNSDSVLGMYDVENDYFYTNNGSGTFTGGAMP